MELLRKTAVFRVESQTKDKTPDEVTTISLSGVPIAFTLIEPFMNLTHLYLVATKPKLTTLSLLELARFPKLRVLDVSDNAINVAEAPSTAACSALRRLLMPNNQVTTMDEVKRLASAFPKLEILDLFDNAVMTSDSFKEIFVLFPALAALNSKTREGEEVMVEDSDESDFSEEEDESDEEEDSDDEENDEAVFSDDDEDEESNVDDASSTDTDANGGPAVKKSRTEPSSS